MRTRRREVNIFNVSLLDILCGALGAFCFLMIVLLPYWKPPGADARDVEQQYQQALKELEDLRNKIKRMPNSGPDLERQVQKLFDDFRRKQRQLTDSMNKLEQTRRELDKEKDRNRQLEMRRPMVITMLWSSPGHNVDLYVRWRGQTSKGQRQEAVDATKNQSVFFSGDLYTQCGRGPCYETWMVRDVPIGSEFEIHYKFMAANGNTAPASVGPVSMNHAGGFFVLPRATIPSEKTAVLVGVATLDENLKLRFRPEPQFAAQFNRDNQSPATPERK